MYSWGRLFKNTKCSLQTRIYKCKHTGTHNHTPHCDRPAQLVTQTVGPSKVPFRGDGESRGGGGSDRVSESNKEQDGEKKRRERTSEKAARRQSAGTGPSAWPHPNLSVCMCLWVRLCVWKEREAPIKP